MGIFRRDAFRFLLKPVFRVRYGAAQVTSLRKFQGEPLS